MVMPDCSCVQAAEGATSKPKALCQLFKPAKGRMRLVFVRRSSDLLDTAFFRARL